MNAKVWIVQISSDVGGGIDGVLTTPHTTMLVAFMMVGIVAGVGGFQLTASAKMSLPVRKHDNHVDFLDANLK